MLLFGNCIINSGHLCKSKLLSNFSLLVSCNNCKWVRTLMLSQQGMWIQTKAMHYFQSAENWLQGQRLNLPVWTAVPPFLAPAWKPSLTVHWIECIPTQLLFRDVWNELSALNSLPLLRVMDFEQERQTFGETLKDLKQGLKKAMAEVPVTIKRQPEATIDVESILWPKNASYQRWHGVTFA